LGTADGVAEVVARFLQVEQLDGDLFATGQLDFLSFTHVDVDRPKGWRKSRLWLLGQRRIDPIGSGGNGRGGRYKRGSQEREEPTERQHGKVFLPGQPEKASRVSGGCDKPAPPPGKATPGAGSECTGTTDPRQSTPQGTSPVPLIFASNVAPGRLVAHERL